MKKNEKILITGGSGLVGSQVDFGIKPTQQDLDLTKPITIEKSFDKNQPETVLHLAAFTNMIEAEKHPKQAHKINVKGTYNLAQACKKRNINFVYFSTCAIFDGKKEVPYNETDIPCPLNVYGKTKWLGEITAQKLIPECLILRTGWLFGGGPIDNQFVKLFFKKCIKEESIKATSDRQGSPTYIPDLLKKTKELIDNKASGIIHVVNSGHTSYFEVAKEIKQIIGSHNNVEPVKAKEIESPLLERGSMEALISKKIHLRPWQQPLQEYISLLS